MHWRIYPEEMNIGVVYLLLLQRKPTQYDSDKSHHVLGPTISAIVVTTITRR